MKRIYKIDINEFYRAHDIPIVDRNPKSENVIYSVEDGKIIASRITNREESSTKTFFKQENLSYLIKSNIEIQFALYQFYVMYNTNKKDSLNEKIQCQICYRKDDGNLSDSKLSILLSIFDSLIVNYCEDKVVVIAQFVRIKSTLKVYEVYKDLHRKSLLNPFIIELLNTGAVCKVEDIEGSNKCIYQYNPQEKDSKGTILSNEEIVFINFIREQLDLLSELSFYCQLWNECDVEKSILLKKLKIYFEKIYFLSDTDEFQSNLIIILN